MKNFYLELKIIATSYQDLEDQIKHYKELFFVSDGCIENNGDGIYWTVLKKHDGLVPPLSVMGWIKFEGNENLFEEYANANCWCKFDDGTECRYSDEVELPMAVMTHFKM